MQFNNPTAEPTIFIGYYLLSAIDHELITMLPYQEPAVNSAAARSEPQELMQRVVVQQEQDVVSEEEPLDPWTERARRLRPAWTSEQQGALARALRHAPNDGAAVVMAQVMLGVARRC